MSRIPRCNASATKLRPPAASTPFERKFGRPLSNSNAKVGDANGALSFSSGSELSMIENVRPPNAKAPLKRTAAPLHNPVRKQARPAPKTFDRSSAKCDKQQQGLRAAEEAREEAERRAEELERRLEDAERRELEVAAVNGRLEADVDRLKLSALEAADKIETLSEEKTKLTAELARLKVELSSKTAEAESLKTILASEVEKNSQVGSELEETRTQLSVRLGEIAFCEMKLSAAEEKNDRNRETIVELRTEKERLEADLNAVSSDKTEISSRLRLKEADCEEIARRLEEKSNVLRSSEAEAELLRSKILNYTGELFDLKKNNEYLTRENDKKSKIIEELTTSNDELQRKLETMHDNEKTLRNRIQDLKGHIRVFCRIRPPLRSESSKPTVSVKMLDSNSMELEKTLVNSNTNLSKKQNFIHQFAFDGIFDPAAGQEEVFEEVSSMIQSALDGYNVCIFAYGQTGSGKTYTMEGENSPENVGIVPRAIAMIFDRIPKLNALGWDFTISASFIEIYNECIYDLLDSSREGDHSIKMSDSKGSDVYVSNLKEETVADAESLRKLLLISQRNRMTAATLSNERSSRSHSIAKIKFNGVRRARNEKFTSNLNFVDLAGSESGKNSQRMDETKSINKSLSELSKVILALQAKQSHIPYRNSKLTHLLMPSLGGNSKTLMLINISQLDECYQETVNSLRFATAVNNCRNSASKKNVSSL